MKSEKTNIHENMVERTILTIGDAMVDQVYFKIATDIYNRVQNEVWYRIATTVMHELSHEFKA